MGRAGLQTPTKQRQEGSAGGGGGTEGGLAMRGPDKPAMDGCVELPYKLHGELEELVQDCPALRGSPEVGVQEPSRCAESCARLGRGALAEDPAYVAQVGVRGVGPHLPLNLEHGGNVGGAEPSLALRHG